MGLVVAAAAAAAAELMSCRFAYRGFSALPFPPFYRENVETSEALTVFD